MVMQVMCTYVAKSENACALSNIDVYLGFLYYTTVVETFR